MKYQDPLEIVCPQCSLTSLQPVSDLFGLRASCPHCGTRLDQIGRGMRATSDEVSDSHTVVSIVFDIEESLGSGPISDSELELVHTLRDLAQVVQNLLPQGIDRPANAIELVRRAAAKLPNCSSTEIDLDARPIDAIDPTRWDRQ